MSGRKRGSVAVVGAAESDLGLVAPHTSPVDLMAQATLRALDDAGLKLSDVDSHLRRGDPGPHGTDGARRISAHQAQIFRWHDHRRLVFHVARHARAGRDRAGLCEVAVIAYGSTQRSVSRAAASPREYNHYESPYKPILPISAYALAAARHMHQFGTTREHLAEVAVSARKWALLNPAAWEKEPLTIEQVLESPHGELPVHGA